MHSALRRQTDPRYDDGLASSKAPQSGEAQWIKTLKKTERPRMPNTTSLWRSCGLCELSSVLNVVHISSMRGVFVPTDSAVLITVQVEVMLGVVRGTAFLGILPRGSIMPRETDEQRAAPDWDTVRRNICRGHAETDGLRSHSVLLSDR
ncbi:hypothetical protein PENSOL_c030G07897 [Penicillium solitum]|uniref:Uncharacterized protein n=1 Tax=Penicillium solitum TaxID=60172 RepID=A0A1V6QXB7_9EURO|nr:uncharacterized protein PENSOL_c030G07897 [Penicillium solitum]OQD93707.1 hypothetical protein PENSOL_c030G07897 [Penicillium solitum]